MNDKTMSKDTYVAADFSFENENRSDQTWLKAAIVSHASELIEPQITWKWLLQLKSILKLEEYNAFKGDLTQIIFPMVITEHGYKKSLGSRDQANAWSQINGVIRVLADLGYDSFINSGTLLGAIRQGRLLAHDDDADLGVIVPGADMDEIIANTMQLMISLAEKNMLSMWHVENGCTHISLSTELPMDLFICWQEHSEIFAYPHGKIEKEAVLPFKTIIMEGHALQIPSDSEAFLALCYGPNWRVPDDTFSYPWGRSLSHFVEYNDKFNKQLQEILPELIATREKW